MPHQILVTIRATIEEGRSADVASLLDALHKCVEHDGSPFSDMPGVHFARVFVLPGDAALEVPDTLVYLAEIDAPLKRHLHAVTDDGTGPLGLLFGQCEGFPHDGSPRDRRRWARQHRVGSAARYVHRVGRGVEQVRDESRLRAAIEGFLDDPARDRAGHSPAEVHGDVRRFVGDRPDLAAMLDKPDGPGLLFRARELLHAVAVPALLLPFAPLLVVGLPAWVLLVRALEARDVPETARPSREHVAAITRGEDHGVANPFTAYGEVKAGAIRRITINVALRGLDYACRHVFTRDNLAGVRSIHFARWVLLDGGRRVVFASDYDGSQESYMDDFIDRLAWGINLVFGNGLGFPTTRWMIKDGARYEEYYKRYLRRHQVASVWFSAYPGLSARNLDDNSQLRAGLAHELSDEEAQAWLALL